MKFYNGTTTANISDINSNGFIQIPVDLNYISPRTIEIANAICLRYDAGICKHICEHSGVLEYDTR